MYVMDCKGMTWKIELKIYEIYSIDIILWLCRAPYQKNEKKECGMELRGLTVYLYSNDVISSSFKVAF